MTMTSVSVPLSSDSLDQTRQQLGALSAAMASLFFLPCARCFGLVAEVWWLPQDAPSPAPLRSLRCGRPSETLPRLILKLTIKTK